MKIKINILFVAVGIFLLTSPASAAQNYLNVPFTSQAPEHDWSEPWQNTCEEAAIVMVDNYYKNNSSISTEQAVDQILAVYNQKEEAFGHSKDESLAKMQQMIELYTDAWTTTLVNKPTIDQIKSEIDAARPVIMPVYGRIISNPYYTDPGPTYHMVVIDGYDDNTREFITQDPGTQFGKDFRFDYDELMNGNHDLQKPNYTDGARNVLFTAFANTQESAQSIARQVAGFVLLQAEANGEAWYVDPVTLTRYYLKDGGAAYEALRQFGLGITNADLAKIPVGSEMTPPKSTNRAVGNSLVNRLSGRILLQVQENGEAWYIHPTDGKRYYMKDGPAAYELMRFGSLGISNENLAKITNHFASPQP